MSNDEELRPGDFARWRFEVARHIVHALAEFASVGVFGWWKEPGNSYITFYPTALLPNPDDEPQRTSYELGQKIFASVVQPDKPGPCLTLGAYGSGLEIPAWAHPDGEQVELGGYFDDPAVVARRALEYLDGPFLASLGSPDPATTSLVDDWLRQAVETLAAHPERSANFGSDKQLVPMGMWVIELDDGSATGYEIWWPDRKHLLMKW